MGESGTTFTELVQSWERIRFFGRIFDEAVHLRAATVRWREDGVAVRIEFCCGEIAVKSMSLLAGEAKALLEWIRGRQPAGPAGTVFHGAPTGYFSAELRLNSAPGELCRFVSPTHADIADAAVKMGIDMDGVRGLEAALEKFPGLIILAGPDTGRLEKLLSSLSFLFGWVNGGVVDDRGVAAIDSAASEVPLFGGVCAATIGGAVVFLSRGGAGIADLPIRGFLFDEAGKIVWHPPLGPAVAALRAKSVAVRSRTASKIAARQSSKQSLLVVEDDLDQAQILQLMLQAEGYEVFTASNGVDALEFLREHPVNGVITDLMMPVLDGKQLLQSLRRDPKFKSLPVLVLSVIDDETREHELRDLGANDYCSKASQPKAIVAKIKKVLS